MNNDISLIVKRTAEKLLKGVSKISVYKSSKYLILYYIDEKIMNTPEAKNQLSISLNEIEACRGSVENYLQNRVKLFIELYDFLRNIMPEIQFISEDENTIGVTFHKDYMKDEELVRLYFEKQIFSDFVNNPEETKDNFLGETKKREKIIQDAV